MVEIPRVRELSQDELVSLVADIWEQRDGWSTQVVDPPQTVEIQADDQEMELTLDDTDASPNLVAVQSDPYIDVAVVYVRQGGEDDIVDRSDFRDISGIAGNPGVDNGIIVTTGAAEEGLWDTRMYHGDKIVNGAKLCDLIEQYADQGLDYDQYFGS